MLSLILELTLRDVLGDLPHDGGTLIVLVLLVSIVLFIWHGSRRNRSGPRSSGSSHSGRAPGAR